MVFGERIKEARKAKRLTQKQLAERMEVAEITIRQYEGDKRVPSIEQLKKIADALDMDFSALLGIATVIDGVYTQDEMQEYINEPITAAHIGQAYEKAPPPIQRTVEVALEPYMNKEADPK